MTWDEIKNLANNNQGVIAVFIPMFGVLFWMFRKKFFPEKASKEHYQRNNIDYHPEDSVVRQVNITQHNFYGTIQQIIRSSESEKSIKVKKELRLIISQLPFQSCRFYIFELPDNKFILEEYKLFAYIQIFEVEGDFLKMNKNDLVSLLRLFHYYQETNNLVNSDYSFYDFIKKELKDKDIIMEIDINNEKLLKIPFKDLSAKNFDIQNHCFSMYLKQGL